MTNEEMMMFAAAFSGVDPAVRGARQQDAIDAFAEYIAAHSVIPVSYENKEQEA